MASISVRALPAILLLLAAPALAQFPAFDPERIFMLGNADLDGEAAP